MNHLYTPRKRLEKQKRKHLKNNLYKYIDRQITKYILYHKNVKRMREMEREPTDIQLSIISTLSESPYIVTLRFLKMFKINRYVSKTIMASAKHLYCYHFKIETAQIYASSYMQAISFLCRYIETFIYIYVCVRVNTYYIRMCTHTPVEKGLSIYLSMFYFEY